MRNLSRLSSGARNQLKNCLSDNAVCKLCNAPSVAAIGAWDGWRPACQKHADYAEAHGYEVVRKDGAK